MSKKIPHTSILSNEESAQNGFLHVPSDLFNDFSLSLEEERILAIVRSYGGSCHWSIDRFAKFCRCSTRHVMRAISNLIESGRLRKESRGNRSNLYSEVVSYCQPVIVTHSHSDSQSLSYCQPVTTIVTHSHIHSDSQSPYIDINNTNDKDSNNTTPVADAPATTPTLAEPATPTAKQPRSKKKPFPDQSYWEDAYPNILLWMISKGFAGTEVEAKAWVDRCVERMRDACEANPTKYKYENWTAAFKNWNRDKLGAASVNPSVLTYPQAKLVFQDFWNEAHGLDRPDVSFVTKEQEIGIFKTIRRFAEDETGYLVLLKSKRPEQVDHGFIDFWTTYKTIAQETNK